MMTVRPKPAAAHVLPKALRAPPAENARIRLGDETRERILEKAADLLLRSSVSGMSISELVALSGVPASSIYWHFGSKEGLVVAVASAVADRWLASLPDPGNLPATGEARVRAGIGAITGALARDSRAVTLVTKVGMELGGGTHSGKDIIRLARRDVIDYGVRLFAPAFDTLAPPEARAAAARMSGLLMALADGIAVQAAIEGRGGASAKDYRALDDLALLLYRNLAVCGGVRDSRKARPG